MQDLTVTLIQSDLQWEDRRANLDMFDRRIRSLSEPTEVILLPEMFTTGFSMRPELLAEGMDGEGVAWMRRMARERRVIVSGSLMIREDGLYRNRLIWMLPDGQMGYYDKRHCFGLAGEAERYHPGRTRLIASVKGWQVNLCICYDLRFPVWSRQSLTAGADRPEYDLLVYLANWPEVRIHAWRSLLVARAIENQCYVVGVNRVGTDGHGIAHAGHSMVVDPLGEILGEEVGLEADLTRRLDRGHLEAVRSRMPFWRDADPFTLH
jgi:predicted amidohydrolase